MALLCASVFADAQNSDPSDKKYEIDLWAPVSTIPDSTRLDLIKSSLPTYPGQAASQQLQGKVVVRLHISETGDVNDVDIVRGDPILAKSVVNACKTWKYNPFIKHGIPVEVTLTLPFNFFFTDNLMKNEVSVELSSTPDRVKDPTERMFNEPLPTVVPANTPTPSPEPEDSKPSQRVQLSAKALHPYLLRQIAPVYPEKAREGKIRGKVQLHAVVSKQGEVAELKPISGPKELMPAAIGAVQQWRYKPYLVDGQPVEVETTIVVTFELQSLWDTCPQCPFYYYYPQPRRVCTTCGVPPRSR